MLTPFAAAVCLLALLFLSTNPLRFSRIEAKCQHTDLESCFISSSWWRCKLTFEACSDLPKA
jgi:hypothetical protein